MWARSWRAEGEAEKCSAKDGWPAPHTPERTLQSAGTLHRFVRSSPALVVHCSSLSGLRWTASSSRIKNRVMRIVKDTRGKGE